MAVEGMNDRPGEIHRLNQLPKTIIISGTTDGSGNFNADHGLTNYLNICGIDAVVNYNSTEMRDPTGYAGKLYADSTKVYLTGSLGGAWASKTIKIILFYR